MSKRVKILVSVVAAILLLAVGTTAAVMAQEEPAPPEEEANGLLARVADILDIPQEDLIDAFKQARQEIRQEIREKAVLRAIERAKEKGLINDEEADQILEWWEERPEVLDRIWSPRLFDCPALGNGHTWNKEWHGTFGMWRGDGGWHGVRPPELTD